MTLPAANWEQNSDRSGPRLKNVLGLLLQQYSITAQSNERKKKQKLENPDEWSFFFPFLSESTELASADFHLFEHFFSSTYPPLCGHKTLFEIWLSLLILQQMWWKDSLVFVWSVHFSVWRLQGWHCSVTRSWSGFLLSGEVWEVLSKFCSKWICMNIVKADACEGIIYTILFWQTFGGNINVKVEFISVVMLF